MYRTIKFRAWETEQRFMYSNEDLIDEEIELSHISHPCKTHIFMQYSGLKDKNGVEIYFGDILLEKNSKRPSGISDYHQDKRMLVQDSIHYISFTNINYNKQAEYYNTYDSSYYKDTMNNIEVIGNIYEQIHLLGNNS
jgi:uncharacterized phage protein (TIGR01671 family)